MLAGCGRGEHCSTGSKSLIKIAIILQYSFFNIIFQLTFTTRFYTFFRCAVSFREANTASVGLSARGTKCVEVIPWQNGQSSLRTLLDCLLYVKVLFAETQLSRARVYFKRSRTTTCKQIICKTNVNKVRLLY